MNTNDRCEGSGTTGPVLGARATQTSTQVMGMGDSNDLGFFGGRVVCTLCGREFELIGLHGPTGEIPEHEAE